MSSSWPPPPDPPLGEQPVAPGQPPPSDWLPPQPQHPVFGGPPNRPEDAVFGGQRSYPQQTLSEQEVKPGRSRKPLVIGLVVALVLAIGAGVAWQLLQGDGESTRAAYCSALKDLTHNGDLMRAVPGADASSLNQVVEVQRLAPDAVKDDWDALQSAAQSAQSGEVDYSMALRALTSLRAISDDADSNCGITMDMPGLR